VAGRGFGGLAGVAGIAGVALSCVSVFGFGLGVSGGAEGSGALADGGVDDGVPPDALVPPLGGAGVDVVGAGVVGVGAGGGEGAGVEGVPTPPRGGEAGVDGVRAGTAPEPKDARIGLNPARLVRVSDFALAATAWGTAGETSTGTLRACVLGTESSRMAERSFVVKACTQSWAEATAPAATAPT
jgi:hypothetical protein